MLRKNTHFGTAQSTKNARRPVRAAGLVTRAWWRQALVDPVLAQQRQNVLLALVGLCDHRG